MERRRRVLQEVVHRVPRRLQWTIRLRLTLLYGALFLATGVLLLAVTYVLVAHTPRAGSPPPSPRTAL
ncbi:MAG: Histidine kinase [Actinomycetia bacterium]|nr:Histidine kinase [Actinomycetes bacterium]